MLLDSESSQLVLIDYQAKLMPVIFEGDLVLKNASRLAQAAKLLAVSVWATEQNPSRLGPNSTLISQYADRTLAKMHFSAMAEGLAEWLRPPVRQSQAQANHRRGGNARSLPKHLQHRPGANQPDEPEYSKNSIVIAGCEAHVCLLQTALNLIDDEFDVWVVTDACSSRTERNRDAAFDRLATVGAELVTTEMVLFEWLRTAEHEAFREFLPLIK